MPAVAYIDRFRQPVGSVDPNPDYFDRGVLFNPGSTGGLLEDVAFKQQWLKNGDAGFIGTNRGLAATFDGVGDYWENSNTGTRGEQVTGNTGTFFCWCPTVGDADASGNILFTVASGIVYFWVDQNSKTSIFGSAMNSGGSAVTWFNTTDNSIVMVSATGLAAGLKTYVRGEDSGHTWSGDPSTFAAGAKNLYLGRYSSGESHNFQGSILVAGWTSKIWTAIQAKQFHDNPFVVFRRTAQIYMFPTAAGGLGIPIAAYHYNHHLGSMAS